MKATIVNKPLTYYPQVKLFDLILARVLVEIVTGFLGLLVVVSLLTALGVDPRPVNSFIAMDGLSRLDRPRDRRRRHQRRYRRLLSGMAGGICPLQHCDVCRQWRHVHAKFFAGKSLLLVEIQSGSPAGRVDEVRILSVCRVAIDYLYVLMFGLTCMVMGLLILKHIC